MRQTDRDGNGLNPVDVPDSADHFHRDMRARSPLFPVYGQDFRKKGSGGAATSGVEDASDGPTRLAVSIPAGVMIQRMLDSPGFVEKLLANTSGHTLSESDRVNGRVPDAHVMPIPTRRTDGVRQGAMYGDIAASSSIFGIDSIMVGQGDKEDRVVVGDTVMVVDLPGQAEGADALPCRLESLVWNKDCDIAGGSSSDRIVARVQRCLLNNDLCAEMKVEDDAPGTKTGVWEVTNDRVDLDTSKLVGRCEVVVSDYVHTGEDGSALPSFRGVGFVKRLRSGRHTPLPSPDPAVKHLPWRPEGAERLFYDRRQNGSHWNNDKERRVFLTPAHLFTDAFDFRNQEGVSYPIKATLLSPFASTSQAFRREPEAWPLVGLSAPRVRWQDDLGFILEVISVLHKGCRARLAIADKVEEDLADGDYVGNRRTDDQTEYAPKVISTATTGTQRQALSSKHGVTPQEVENPFRKHVHMNMVRTFGIDVFRQDAQNSLRKIFKRLLGGLSKAKGVPLLSCLVKDPSLRVAGTPPLRDFVSDGGFSALSGMDVSRLSSVALLAFRPVLRNVASMKCLTTAPFRNDIRAELGATTDNVVTDTDVMEKLRALLLTSSETTHLLRSNSFNDEAVAAIDRSQREKVSLMSMLEDKHGGRLCSNHQGLHFAKNATDYGELSDCHAGESRHKSFKSCAKTASGRDNQEHIVRRENDVMAAEAMAEGVRWTAWGYDKTKREWVKKTVQASPACRELLRTISEWEIETRRHGTGRPRESLSGTSVSSNGLRLRARRGGRRRSDPSSGERVRAGWISSTSTRHGSRAAGRRATPTCAATAAVLVVGAIDTCISSTWRSSAATRESAPLRGFLAAQAPSEGRRWKTRTTNPTSVGFWPPRRLERMSRSTPIGRPWT
ncbi:unnamed protein product, partial [Ectocarpus sp. 12 AP-2014]